MAQVSRGSYIPWIGDDKTTKFVKFSESCPTRSKICCLIVGLTARRRRGSLWFHNVHQRAAVMRPSTVLTSHYSGGLKASCGVPASFFTRTTVILWKPSLKEGGRRRSCIFAIAS